jgi:hypothetical protein
MIVEIKSIKKNKNMKILKAMAAIAIIVACTVYSISTSVKMVEDSNYRFVICEIQNSFDRGEISDDQCEYLFEIANNFDKKDVLEALEKEKNCWNDEN